MGVEKPRISAITGPTASGKTNLVITLSEFCPLEVISCDSRNIYKKLDIGTAKPTKSEREKVAFHLIDIVEPTESFSVEQFSKLAMKKIFDILGRKKLPVLEGGTGLYLASIAYSYEFGKSPPIEGLRKHLNEIFAEVGYLSLLPELTSIFKNAEKEIDIYNPTRMIRFIEKSLISMDESELRSTLAELNCSQIFDEIIKLKEVAKMEERESEETPSFNVVGFTLEVERNLLWQRIRERVRKMFAEGLVEEVRELLALGVKEDSQALSGIGYAEVVEYLKGKMSIEEAEERVVIATRQLAKRQETWNKHQFQGFTRIPYSTTAEMEKAVKLLRFAFLDAYEHNKRLLW